MEDKQKTPYLCATFSKKNDSEIFEGITYITPVVQDEEETVETRCNETDLGLKRLKKQFVTTKSLILAQDER